MWWVAAAASCGGLALDVMSTWALSFTWIFKSGFSWVVEVLIWTHFEGRGFP